MNYFYSQWSDKIQHVYASEMSVLDIQAYLANGAQRSLLSYEAPPYPVCMTGSLEQCINGQYLAKLKKGGRLESWGIYDCEAFLEVEPTTEPIVDLSPRRRRQQNA